MPPAETSQGHAPSSPAPGSGARRLLRALSPARLFPAEYQPVITGLSCFLWGYPITVPAWVVLYRAGSGVGWWAGFVALCIAVLLVPWRYRHAGRGGPRGVDAGITDMALVAVALTLAVRLSDRPDVVRIQFNSLVMLLTFIYPYLHRSGRATAIVAAASYVALWGVTGLTHLRFSPAHQLPWQQTLIASWPIGLVAGGMYYCSRLLHEQAATQQRLTGIAMTDALTGLLGRSLFIEEGERCVAAARAGGAAFSLILADLDGLKDINDSFGHAAGDLSLRCFGGALRQRAGPRDLVARLGGDEFAILAFHGDGGTQQVIDRYTPALDATLFIEPVSGIAIRLSGSWGLATACPETGALVDLFALADEQLIRHKAVARPLAAVDDPADPPFVPRGRRALAEALASLMALARDVAGATDGAEFLRRAATGAAELLGARGATISVIEPGQRWGERARRTPSGWSYEAAEFPPGRSIIQHVLDTGAAYVSNDIEHDPIADHEAAQRIGIHSCLCVPVHGADSDVVGTLFLPDKLGRAPYTEHDVRVAQAFADLAGAALQKTEALAGARRRTEIGDAILTAVAQVHGSLPLTDGLARVVREAAALLDATAAALALWEDGQLHIAARHDARTDDEPSPPVAGGQLLPVVAATGRPLAANDPDRQTGFTAQVAVPVRGRDGAVLGVFAAAFRSPGQIVTSRHQALLEAFAEHAALVLELRAEQERCPAS